MPSVSGRSTSVHAHAPDARRRASSSSSQWTAAPASRRSAPSHVRAWARARPAESPAFTLHHRAGYAAYVRAIYCVPSLCDDGSAQEIRETERLGPAINLVRLLVGDATLSRQGRDENRTLKGLDIPSGAEVQLVLERASAARAKPHSRSRCGRQSARHGERGLALLGTSTTVPVS